MTVVWQQWWRWWHECGRLKRRITQLQLSGGWALYLGGLEDPDNPVTCTWLGSSMFFGVTWSSVRSRPLPGWAVEVEDISISAGRAMRRTQSRSAFGVGPGDETGEIAYRPKTIRAGRAWMFRSIRVRFAHADRGAGRHPVFAAPLYRQSSGAIAPRECGGASGAGVPGQSPLDFD